MSSKENTEKTFSSSIRIGITLGDPLGIGAEITEKALHNLDDPGLEFVLYGDETLAQSFRERLPSRRFVWVGFDHLKHCPNYRWTFETCGRASMAYLERATADAINQQIDALVTAPIAKANWKLAGYDYPGHTEFLAEKTKVRSFVMMMAAPGLKVALVTIHVPLARVPIELSAEKIFETVRITYQALQNNWGILNPRLAVCGLNPHAGENGLLGDEEIRIVSPAISALKQSGYNVFGPMVPDAVFHQAISKQFDAIICLYHDQGLIPFKMLHFHDGVNVTLGLPIIRTSPDHGVAYDIAGKNLADPSSMQAAIRLAIEMTRAKRVFSLGLP